MAAGVGGDRTIAIRDISAVQIKLGGFMPGYIVFSYPGSMPFRGGIVEATQDPDAFIFRKTENEAMSRFKAALDEAMESARAAPSSHQASLPNELEKLATMRDAGHLTLDEFERAKAKLLA